MNLRNKLLLTMFSLSMVAQAATLTLTTKYGATGGLAGDFNQVGDVVNGRTICPNANDNSNSTPGCDMSGDAGYTNNGTDDPSDDSYSGDLVVRTNDSFELGASYSWTGTKGEDEITIKGTLPAGKGFIWNGIPGSCNADLSSLSADRKVISCVRKGADSVQGNNVGSYSETMWFAVQVEGDAPNGSKPGDITIELSETTGTAGTLTDGVLDGDDNNKLVITSSPRWNIDGHSGAGYYTTSYGQTDDQDNKGWYLWYNFTIEVDEVPGEADDPINPSLGNEAIKGGKDATLSFTTDLSTVSPNAKLVTWDSSTNFPAGQACNMDAGYTNGDEPYPSLNATYPDRSILTSKGTMAVSCSARGQEVTVEVQHVDATLTDAPIKNRNGGLLPVNRKIATVGVMRVFVPLSDVEAGADGISGNDDDGELRTTNCYENFNPLGISDTRNFNGVEGGESTADNCYSITLYASRGSWSKSYRKGWSDQAIQRAEWNREGETIGWSAPPTDAAIVMGGDGTVTPEGKWGTYIIYNNTGGVDIERPMMCDVIDTETYTMDILNPTTDNAGTFLDDTKHAVDLNYGPTETIPELKIEYAVGYIGDWPPNPDVSPDYAVANECNATSITWYPDYVTAATHGAVSKVRLSAPLLPVQKYMAMRIKHKARSNFLTSGDPIVNKTLLVNYGIYKSALTDDKYISNSYRPHDADNPHEGGYHGDRLTMQRAKVRILKEMQPTAVSPGSEATVTLTPSFTNDSLNPERDTVRIVDVLPKGLAYKNGSVTGDYNGGMPYGEPQVLVATDANCNEYAEAIVAQNHPCGTLNSGTEDETILVWDLGELDTGIIFTDLNFTTSVTIDAASGVLANYAQIESPADDSTASKRLDNANVNNSVPAALLIVKSVQTPLHEINKDGDLNWMEFKVGIRNGSASDLSDLDVIDLLPFNGDGVEGNFTFTPQDGITVDRNREPATNFVGTFKFDSMLFDDNAGECDASNIKYWFTNAAGPLDISPKSTTNTKADGTPTDIWCEGDATGVAGGCPFTNEEITAVRTRGAAVPGSATCFLNLKFATNDNKNNNVYSNTAAAMAKDNTGTYLDGVLSNTVSAKVFASSVGDYVWYDRDADGIQDNDENGMDGVTVKLYKDGVLIGTTQTSNGGKYSFRNLLSGTGYVVEVLKPEGYLVTSKGAGSSADSDIKNDGKTDAFTLEEDEDKTDIDAGFYTPILSGFIFDDGNHDGTVNGTKFNNPAGVPLFVTLLDGNGAVLASKAVLADGSYAFDAEDSVIADSNYTIVLATVVNATISDLPLNWNSADGEHIGAGAGLDDAIDGKIYVEVVQSNVENINFGINEKPVAQNVVEPEQFNPAGTNSVDVPDLNISDKEDGTPTTITITSLPNNGTLYYNGVAVTIDQNITNLNSGELTIDPDSGAQMVVFNYTTTDRSGVVSDAATVTMPFKDLKVSGNLFIDGNGDGNVNGTATSSADGTQLYVTLVNGRAVVASSPLSAGGTYEFDIEDGLQSNTNYTVVLSDNNGSTVANLPVDWDNNDGENINSVLATGNDGSKDGVLAVNVVESDVTQADFGINKKPNAEDVTEPEQINPGASSTVDVPDLNISDNETQNNLTVTITTVPDNATLYYGGAIVDANTTINNFDNNLLTIDPNAGSQAVTFDYSVTDAAGTVSDEATVSLSFANIMISGTLFNDGNGNGNVDGNETNHADATQLYVTLVDASGTPIASKALEDNGTYYFDSIDDLSPDTNYTVVLTDTLNSTGATLPATWNNADGEKIGLVGLDGNADGIVAVEVQRVDIPEINFGINKQPVAEDKAEAVQYNPGSTTQVVVPDLNVTDKEDGVPTIVTITVLPTNGILYYEGNPVVANTPIADINLSGFTFDPNDGDLTATFKYTTTDRVDVDSEVATVTLPFTALKISGNIFNDGDNDGTVNGVGISAPSGTQLFVTLLDENGTALASKEVNGDGTYTFGDTDGIIENSDYKVVLSTGENDVNASLPEDWSNLDGEHIGTNAGTDGSKDGMISVAVASSDIVQVNFGINKKPVAGDHIEPLQLNPGTDVQVNVPDLNITDNEDGTLSTVTIQTVPSHGTLYYDGVEVVAGQVINDLNNSLLTLDPDNGDQTVSFTYSTVDGVGVESDIATVSMLFDGLEILGNIFNDGNNDNTVNGTKISDINGTQLYATLLDDSDVVMSTMAIDNNGSYLFTGTDGIVPSSSYSVVLSSEANATTSTLPTDWNHADGEHIGTGVGLDGTADGFIAVEVVDVDVPEVNFGVNKRPKAQDKTENLRINPGSNNQVSVPTLEISDREDGQPTTVVITTLPTNGILYYNGVAVVLDENITNVDVSKFTIDPDHGDLNVTFNYKSIDATGWKSEPAEVVMPFYGLEISGQVFLDVTDDHNVDGPAFASTYGLPVYATLVDDNGAIVASIPVDSNGSYLFDINTGIAPSSDYKVVLSSEVNTTAATLPSNWEHADSNNNGIIDVAVALSNVTNIDFGLNQQPVVTDVVGSVIVNPDGNKTVDVPALDIGFNEDGTSVPTTVTLTNLPDNGVLYYNGVAVVEGQSFADFNNTLLTVDPSDYNVTVEFTYTVEDTAGFESEPATVKMPFDDSDTDGDGIKNGQDLDDDNDGILDTVEEATAKNGGDTDGDGISDRLDLDSDGDGILDLEESNSNPESVDADGNGVLDSTTDEDRDGVMDSADTDDSNATSTGTVVPVDTDSDGTPDFQDVDSDNDGLSDVVESGTDANLDSDSNGVLDDLTDSDSDGIADVVDVDNNGTAAPTPDTDGDGSDNYRDLDSDGDTLLDVDEINATDANHDGLVDVNGTLVDGTTLPDENNNSIPDVLEVKLEDDVRSAPAGSVVTIDLLENDSGDVDPTSISLVIPSDFNGTARLSADKKTMVVDGEGEWSVDNNGTMTFTPEAGFSGSPTPILYRASNIDGSKTATAKITIFVTALAGVSADEACPDYGSENGVPTFSIYGLLLMLLMGTIFGARLIRKES